MSNLDSKEFWQNFIASVADQYSNLWESALLFGEALHCFQAEAFQATCTMCRASIEALLYRVRTSNGLTGFTGYSDANLFGLIQWAGEQNLIDGLEQKIDAIRRDGNFGAHLAQKIRKGYSKIAAEDIMAIPTLLDRDTAKLRISDTADVILQIATRKWKCVASDSSGGS